MSIRSKKEETRRKRMLEQREVNKAKTVERVRRKLTPHLHEASGQLDAKGGLLDHAAWDADRVRVREAMEGRGGLPGVARRASRQGRGKAIVKFRLQRNLEKLSIGDQRDAQTKLRRLG